MNLLFLFKCDHFMKKLLKVISSFIFATLILFLAFQQNFVLEISQLGLMPLHIRPDLDQVQSIPFNPNKKRLPMALSLPEHKQSIPARKPLSLFSVLTSDLNNLLTRKSSVSLNESLGRKKSVGRSRRPQYPSQTMDNSTNSHQLKVSKDQRKISWASEFSYRSSLLFSTEHKIPEPN